MCSWFAGSYQLAQDALAQTAYCVSCIADCCRPRHQAQSIAKHTIPSTEAPKIIAADTISTLEDVLRIVPQLRCLMTSHEHVSRNEPSSLKNLRLVSKDCKYLMQGEIHGYSLQLRSLFILSVRQPGKAVQPLKAWKFLHGAQLLRLAVQIQEEEFSPIAPGSIPLFETGEVSHHTAQLRCFISTVGPAALKHTSSLQLTSVQASTTKHHKAPTSVAAIACLIGAACPNLTHLITEGFEPEAAVVGLGSLCPNICSFEMIHSSLFHWSIDSVPSACMLALGSSFPKLTRLCAIGKLYLRHADEWLALPRTLKELRCYELPPQLHTLVAKGLRLSALQVLHSEQLLKCWNVQELSAFLDTVPELRMLSTSAMGREKKFPTPHSIVVDGSLTSSDLWALQNVSLRMDAGLVITGIVLGCGESSLAQGEETLPFECLLKELPTFPGLVHCELLTKHSQLAAGCLSLLAVAFPNITSLVLAGEFTDEHLSKISRCAKLQRLKVVGSKLLTVGGLVRCIAHGPQIKLVEHMLGSTTEKKLRTLLEFANLAFVSGVGRAPQVPTEWRINRHDDPEKIHWVRSDCCLTWLYD